MSLLAWFLDTRIGQALILAAGILLAAWLAYGWAYERGKSACQDEQAKATASANQQVQTAERESTKTAEKIADDTRKSATSDRAENAKTTAAAIERIRYVKIPATCAVALDDSVLAEGRAAVDRANAAKGGLPASAQP